MTHHLNPRTQNDNANKIVRLFDFTKSLKWTRGDARSSLCTMFRHHATTFPLMDGVFAMASWSLQKKVASIITIFLVANIISISLGLTALLHSKESADEIVHVFLKREELLGEIKFNQTNIAVSARDALLAHDANKVGEIISKFSSESVKQNQLVDEFMPLADERQKAQIAIYKTQFASWQDAWENALELHAQGKSEEAATAMREKIAPVRGQMAATLDEVVKMNEESAEMKEHQTEVEFTWVLGLILSVSATAISIGATVSIKILRSLNRSITNVVDNLRSNSEQVAAAAAQISASSQSLSQASTEQAASLQETTASLEEISAMIQKSTDNANNSATKSAESRNRAEEGQRAVAGMLVSMEAISQSNDDIVKQIAESNNKMNEIVRVIREIAEKTKVINEIVFQTKLLSFNASVEAARAGDHGKGFAVVAEEVGNLAQMSGNAAMEISDMLTSSISKVESIAHETKAKVEAITEQGKLKVENGLTVAKQCSDYLRSIVENVGEVAGMVQDISLASKEQSQGVTEINKAMTQLDAVTQQNASTSEEAASAAEELSAQSESLKDCVGELSSTIFGSKAILSPAPVARERVTETPKAKVLSLHKTTASNSKSTPKTTTAKVKMAVGDTRVPPSREDDGFVDV